jgi:S1-C subfamily serine protease
MNDQLEPQRGSSGPPDGWLARSGSSATAIVAFAAGIGTAIVALVLIVAIAAPAPPTLSVRDMEATVDRVLASQVPGPAFSQLVYDAIVPSLVLVETDRSDGRSQDEGAAQNRRNRVGARPAQGVGTAVVVTAAGDVLTALHVVEGSGVITLTYADGSTTTASVAASQPENDIAVLRPDVVPASVVPATLGNPGLLRVGGEAYVVGHPYGLVGSMSGGVISGLDRTFRHPQAGQVFEGLIQFDAAVNPGNSGGPLLNRAGHVTGIVTALLNPPEDSSFAAIGLAVPNDVAGAAAGLPPY